MSIIQPSFKASESAGESSSLQAVIDHLSLLVHPEGGYFVETDRDSLLIPSPFPKTESNPSATRTASTTIYYLLSPDRPQGHFHRNAGRTVHTLHWGRGRYVLIHADEEGKEKRVETFAVGKDILNGEKLQWIVDGGKYKASFLLPDESGTKDSALGCLISETVVPGFEFSDHDFLEAEALPKLVSKEQVEEMQWLIRQK